MALKILLADDSMTAQNMGKKILAENGFDVITVSNGAAAVKKLASEKPDIAILDVYMPGYSGLEVCQKIRQASETAAMPVLLTVGKMEAFQPEEGDRVKADGVMIKPFEASDLVAAVHKFEERLHPASPAVFTSGTQVVSIPIPAEEPRPAAEEEWKDEAAAAPKVAEFSPEMTGMPAFGMEDLMTPAAEPPAPQSEAVAAPAPEPPIPASAPELDSVPQAAAPEPFTGEFEIAPEGSVFPGFETPASAEVASGAIPGMDELLGGHSEAGPVPEPPLGVEFTSAPPVGEVEVAPAQELEPAIASGPVEPAITQDPALATTPEEMAAFTTQFGVESPPAEEEIPLGMGVSVTQPAPEAAPATEPRPASASPWGPPPPLSSEPAAAAEAPPLPESGIDSLVAEFAAAVEKVTAPVSPAVQPGPPVAPASPTTEPDEERVADAAEHVWQELKPQFVAEMLRRLKG